MGVLVFEYMKEIENLYFKRNFQDVSMVQAELKGDNNDKKI